MKRSGFTWVGPVWVFVFVAACGGTTPPVEEATPEPRATTPPRPEPDPKPIVDEPVEEPDVAEKPTEEPKQPRRPLAIYNNPDGPVTVGLDGAVIRVGPAELHIPGGTLSSACNIWFKVDSRYRGDTGKLGSVYLVEVQVPNQKYNMNDARPSRPVPTNGDAFVLKLPLPSGKDSASLAIESVQIGAKNKKTSTWTVVAQTKLETADSGNMSVFEISQLPDAHVHLSTKSAAE